MSLYDDLGANKDDTHDELKRAFKKKAHEHHPDKGGDPEKFQVVQKAWAVLRDHRKRKAYDEGGVPPPDRNIPAEALVNICSLVLQLSDRLDVDHYDIRAAVFAEIHENIRQRQARIAECRKKMGIRRRTSKRWKKLSGGDNVLADMFEREAINQQAAIARLEEELEVGSAMIAILKDYAYEFEAAMPVGLGLTGLLGSGRF